MRLVLQRGELRQFVTYCNRCPFQPGTVNYPAYAARFHSLFADRLNKLCQIGVKEAEDGERSYRDMPILLRAIGIWSWRVGRKLPNQNSRWPGG